MKYIMVIAFILCCFQSQAQLSLADDSLIIATDFYNKTDFQYYQRAGNNADIMESKSKSMIAKYNPVSLLLKGSMWMYQNVISPQLSSPCPYQISCSNFAKQSITEYGIMKGMAISADRLMRCNRISLMDISPLEFDATHHILDDPSRYQWHY